MGNEWKENLKYLLRESDVNYYKNEFLKLIDRRAESKTQDAETQQRIEEEIKKCGEKLKKEQNEKRQEREKWESRSQKQSSEQREPNQFSPFHSSTQNSLEGKETSKNNLLQENNAVSSPKSGISENNNSSNQTNQNNNAEKNTLITKLKAEITELKKNLDLNNTEQKALLAQKETELAKLEGKQNDQEQKNDKSNSPKKDNLTSILLPIGIIFALLLIISSVFWVIKREEKSNINPN